jgi:bacteriocin-like protein
MNIVRKLTDKELDAVSGGAANLGGDLFITPPNPIRPATMVRVGVYSAQADRATEGNRVIDFVPNG